MDKGNIIYHLVYWLIIFLLGVVPLATGGFLFRLFKEGYPVADQQSKVPAFNQQLLENIWAKTSARKWAKEATPAAVNYQGFSYGVTDPFYQEVSPTTTQFETEVTITPTPG